MKCKDTVSYFLFMNSSVGPIYSDRSRFRDGTVNAFKRFFCRLVLKYFDSEARRKLAICWMYFQSHLSYLAFLIKGQNKIWTTIVSISVFVYFVIA